MMALKMENVRNRFPPHFVFNVLNIFVSNLPKEVDAKPLHLLIRILRSYLLTCDKMAVSLEEELQMVMGYSSLRHETNPFLPKPRFHIAKDVDMKLMLPSMIIRIPVENALKHAFAGRDSGSVRVVFARGVEHHTVSVSDDGIGFNPEHANGFGLQIVQATVAQKLHGCVSIVPLACGTTVTFDCKAE